MGRVLLEATSGIKRGGQGQGLRTPGAAVGSGSEDSVCNPHVEPAPHGSL